MLRVGLTGELGSGKSTVARLLGSRGALLLSSDEMARAMMQPGEPVYESIVARFGRGVLTPGGDLDRRALAALAFHPDHPRIEELNALIHPPVLAEQERRLAEIARTQPDAIAVVESALIFTTRYATGAVPWRTRFNRILLVIAPDDLKIARFVQRASAGRVLTEPEHLALVADARQRLAFQRIPPAVTGECLLIENAGDLAALEHKAEAVWATLKVLAHAAHIGST